MAPSLQFSEGMNIMKTSPDIMGHRAQLAGITDDLYTRLHSVTPRSRNHAYLYRVVTTEIYRNSGKLSRRFGVYYWAISEHNVLKGANPNLREISLLN